MSTTDFPGLYLGREYDLAKTEVLPKPVIYDPRDLTTHGVVVGMTGSGKTGLCISLLEELAIEGVPSIIVDLKGDLTNLLLNFPGMRQEDFAPWVSPDEARRKGLSVEEHARNLAGAWQKGLADWGQDRARVAELRLSSDWRLYTPGSEAGLSVSVIQNFKAPRADIGREALNDKVESTATALLGLMKITADPVQSREHILIANLLLNAWSQHVDLDLARLIAQIQSPPLRKIGTFDVDMFYPEEDRLKLAVTLNNLLASPSFSTWIEGEPLDLAAMLRAPDGRPRQLIFYLAHLDDSQRMFFLTLLLQEVLTWTRSQPGSSRLRALLYLDEVFGYLPPHPANPPTKAPLMTLLKQARAFGVGILLATQNPVDLDYKALSNAGTWFVGKLRTDRDKARLLEGLEGLDAEHGSLTDRGYLDAAISALGNQVFLLHDVHRDAPVLFHTRWALSYLAGPLTRDQLVQLKALRGDLAPAANGAAPALAAGACPACRATHPAEARFCMQCGTPLPEHAAEVGAEGAQATRGAAHVPPILPPGTVQYYLPVAQAPAKQGAALVYEPRLLGFADVTLTDRTRKLERQLAFRLLLPTPEAGRPALWAEAEQVSDALEPAMPNNENAVWSDVPETANDPKKLRALERSFAKHLYDDSGITIYNNRSLGLTSEPGEGLEAFLQRCVETTRTLAEPELAPVRAEHQDRVEALRVAEGSNSPKSVQARERWHAAMEKVMGPWQKKAEDVKEARLEARKTGIRITHFGLAWAPVWCAEGQRVPAYAMAKSAAQGAGS